ncbi:MAG: Imm7 family immunity protein [Nocardiopsaceae bacterium]|nr:Imm7 family immunity protein [Nocardiopsaceae bacterium]
MFEFHGWISVHGADEEPPAALRGPDGASVADLVRYTDGGPGLVDLRWMNGELFIHVGGFANHRSPDVDGVFDLFRRVGEAAPGSYGLLHYRDDEEPGESGNAFHVWVMRRGRLYEATDTLLSPVIPTIEDLDDPS